jgi:ammonia channel protein AmtB
MSWFAGSTIVPVVGAAFALMVLYVVARRLWYGNATTLQSVMVQLKDSQPATVNNLTDGAASSVTTGE